MYGVRHHLVHEFPEFRSQIERLKEKDNQFALLLDQYNQTDKKIYGYAQQMQPIDDNYMEQLKRWRVRLKDRLYFILQRSSNASIA